MTKYKLDQWAVVSNATPYTPPELLTQHLCGVRKDHPDYPTDKHITTSPICGKTANGLVVTRSGSKIELLTVQEKYEEEFPDAKQRLLNSLPVVV